LLKLCAEGDSLKKTVIRNFNSLVNKEDYAKSEEREIIEHLVGLSKCG
jgi:hypothetical protein